MRLKDLSSGDYDVKVRARVSVEEYVCNPVAPAVVLYRGDNDLNTKASIWSANLKMKADSMTFQPGKANLYYATAETERTIRLHYSSGFLSSTSDTIILQPSFSFTGPDDYFITIDLLMLVLQIKKVVKP